MMALMRLPIYVLLAALPILPALAQDSLPDESLEPRSYTVEMIIFKYAQDVGIGSEIFPAEEPPFQGAVFEDEVEPFESEPMERTFHDIEMVLLPRDRFTMGDIMDRLVNIGGVGLYSGTDFGEEGMGFFRMNLACPRSLLEQGLEGIQRAMR